MTAESPRSFRTVFMLAVPLATAATVATHPADPRHPHELAGSIDQYIWLHVVLLALIPLLGVVIFLLLRDLRSRLAAVARFMLAPAIALYAAFDALVGIGVGVLAREALALEPTLRPGGDAVASAWMAIPMPIILVSGLATSLWVATVVLAGMAHLRSDSHRAIGWGLVVSGPLFGWGHPGITGMLAMAALIVAVIGDRFLSKPQF